VFRRRVRVVEADQGSINLASDLDSVKSVIAGSFITSARDSGCIDASGEIWW